MVASEEMVPLRGVTDRENAHSLGNRISFSGSIAYCQCLSSHNIDYWRYLSIHRMLPSWVLKTHSESGFRSEEGLSGTKTDHHRHFEALTSRLVYLKSNRHNSSPNPFRNVC